MVKDLKTASSIQKDKTDLLDSEDEKKSLKKKKKAKKKDIEDILENLNDAYSSAEGENNSFNANKRMIYACSLTEDDIAMLRSNGKSVFSIPVILPQLNHQLKNIQDSVPSSEVEALHPEYEPFCEFLTDRINTILEKNYYPNVLSRVAEDAMSGGKGIFELKTEYVNRFSMDQKIVLKAVEDPTKILFDPSAQCPCKEDAMFCAKFIEITKKEFMRLFPKKDADMLFENYRRSYDHDKIKWCYTDSKTQKEIYTICYYYYKEPETKKLYKLKDGTVSYDKKDESEEVLESRDCEYFTVYRMTIFMDEVLEEPEQLNFDELPFIFVGGNEQTIEGKKRSYTFAEGAIDAQRFKSIALSYFISAFQNNQAGKIILPDEANIPGTTDYALKNVTESNMVVYKSRSMADNGEIVQNNPPQYVPPTQLPPHYLEAYNEMSGSIQEILGSQYTSLDQKNMSGTALYHLADFMNASVSPFMQSILYATRQLSKCILGAFGYVMTDEERQMLQQSIPMGHDLEIDNMDYFDIAVTPGVNYKLQQEYAIEQILKLAQVCPSLQEWLNAEGVPMLLDNIPLNKKAEIMTKFEQFMMQKQKAAQMQGQMPNPEMMMAQAKQAEAQAAQMRAQADILEAQTKQAAVSHDIHSGNLGNIIRMHENEIKSAHMNLQSRNEHINQVLEAAKLHQNMKKMTMDENQSNRNRQSKNSIEVIKHLKDQVYKPPKEERESGKTNHQAT